MKSEVHSELKLPTNDSSGFFLAKQKLLLFAVAALAIVAYLPALQNGFVNWDESAYILNNEQIRSINLIDIFSSYQVGNYHPVTMLIYAIEYKFFGIEPIGYHLVSTLLHVINTLLVYRFIRMLCKNQSVAIVASLLFGIHPMHVESVAWAAQLKDLLFTMFFLLSCCSYLKFEVSRSGRDYFLALIFFVLSVLSKAMAVTLPVVLLLIDYFLQKPIKKSLVDKIPFLVISLAFGIVAIHAQSSSGAVEEYMIFSFFQHVAFASFSLLKYLWMMIAPLNLSAYYPYPVRVPEDFPGVYFLFIVPVILLFVGVAYTSKFTRKIIFGFGFFFINILPVLQLIPVGDAMMADRYTYLSSIGIFFLAGEGIAFLLNDTKRKAVAWIILSVSLTYASLTFSRCMIWKDGITLWNDVIRKYENVSVAYGNRGSAYLEANKYPEAITDFNKAISLSPRFYLLYLNRGILLNTTRQYDEALKDFNKAIELNPDFADTYNFRGLLFMNEMRYDEAIRDFDKAIVMRRGYASAYNNKGLLLFGLKRFDEALDNYNKAVSYDPNFAGAYNNRGNHWLSVEKYEGAVKDYDRAISLQPDFAKAYGNRGMALMHLKKTEAARKDFDKVIELQPENSVAYYNRGLLQMSEKENQKAIEDFTSAIKLDSANISAYVNRAVIFQNENNLEMALSDYNSAIAIKPDLQQAYHNRGILLIRLKRFEEAISDFSKLISMDEKNSQAYYNRGIAEYYLGKKQIACDDIQRAAQLGVTPATAMFDKFCKGDGK